MHGDWYLSLNKSYPLTIFKRKNLKHVISKDEYGSPQPSGDGTFSDEMHVRESIKDASSVFLLRQMHMDDVASNAVADAATVAGESRDI
jgi:hypothetical protein